MRISHESIYRFIYAQIRRSKDYGLAPLSGSGQVPARSRPPLRPGSGSDQAPNLHREPPRSCGNRRQCGHWEVDLLHPRKSGAVVLVMQERTTRYTLLSKQAGKHAQPIIEQIKHWFGAFPPPLRRSLTQDNGPEFAGHHQLHASGIKTYFCHHHSPWEKGGIENTNGRIRRYIPRGTDPDTFSDADLQDLARRMNDTP